MEQIMIWPNERRKQLRKAILTRKEREEIRKRMPSSDPVSSALQNRLLQDVLDDYKKSKLEKGADHAR
tara:strand:+ start:129 stop:332 length:204 start_codon:yes stop_codon:yes gene_type:complete